MLSRSAQNWALLVGTFLVLTWSAIDPYDWFTWWMEVAPVFIGLILILATRRRFPLSRLLTILLVLHGIIMMVGAKYSYAEVPIGFVVQDLFDLSRNHYDRFGHFAQGFVPAILAREILLRNSPLEEGKWLAWICLAFCLSFSATYEILEWWSAAWGGETAEAFLGTQGDPWDAQWDMFFAAIGATTALIFFSKAHHRSMERLAA
ncbi:MAG: putative membrane protein [Planctomycetota bacterium]|jgi:putative membrane protein